MNVWLFVTGYPCDVIVLTITFEERKTLDIDAKTTSKHISSHLYYFSFAAASLSFFCYNTRVYNDNNNNNNNICFYICAFKNINKGLSLLSLWRHKRIGCMCFVSVNVDNGFQDNRRCRTTTWNFLSKNPL